MPIYSHNELEIRLEKMSLDHATLLIPENLIRVLDLDTPDYTVLIHKFIKTSSTEQRRRLVEVLRSQNLYSESVLAALKAVSRDLVLKSNQIPYWNGPNQITGLAAVPSPWLVCQSVDAIGIDKGNKILIFGLGGGHTSLICEYLVGENGQIDTLEIDEDLAHRVKAGLLAEKSKINVLVGDALSGIETSTNYDRIYSSLAIEKIPNHWIDLLSPDGRIGTFLEYPPKNRRDLCSFVTYASNNKIEHHCENIYNLKYSKSGRLGKGTDFDGLQIIERELLERTEMAISKLSRH